MTTFECHAGMLDVGFDQVLGPPLEGGTIGHGEGQMMESVAGRLGRSIG
jgi:hypothetical protein